MSQRLGDLLVKEKIITPDQLDKALKAQREQGPNSRLGSTLVHLGFVSDEEVTNFLSRQYGVPAINLQYFEIDSSVVKLIPEETAKRYQILPLSRVGASLTIAMVDPTNVFAMDDKADVELQAEQDDIDLAELEKSADEAPIVKLVNIVMTDAVKRGASDIHIEPYEKEYRVRFRIDGVLQHIMSPPMKLKDAITSRIKIMAKMDIS